MIRRFILLVLALSVFSITALAQSNVGNLVGTVSDASGVIQNATVVVKDNKTGKERTVQSSDLGAFTVPALDIGTYTVTVTSAGHKTFIANEVKIDVGKDYSLPITMEVGNISENVTVVAGVDIINTSNAEIQSTIGPRQLLELPLLTRNPLALILTQPGSASNPLQNTTINGMRTSATNITRDGINIQDNFIRSNATDFAPERPSVDDIDEFTNTTQSGAGSGFGGAQLTLATPRGQNSFHGAAFEFNRNSKFSANNFFNNFNGSFGPNDAQVISGLAKAGDPRNPRPFRNRNQFGGKVSGPVVKDKVFFFGYYEKVIDRLSASRLDTTLTSNARQGIFTYTRADNGQLATANILNPALGTGITAIDPTIQSRILANLPAGNSSETGDSRNTTGDRFSQVANTNFYHFTTRFDYDMSSKNSIWGIYNREVEDFLRNDIDTTFNVVPQVHQPSTNNFFSFNDRYSPSARWTNVATGGWLKSAPIFLRNNAAPANFIIPTLVSNPEVTFLNQGRTVKTSNINDTVTYARGNHAFSFGGLFQNVNIDAFNDASTVATYNLGTNINTPSISSAQFANNALFPGGVPTSQQGTANSLLALLGGIVNTANQTFNVTSTTSGFVNGATQRRTYNYKSLGMFFSDSWRVKPSLTLNLGGRWEGYSPVKITNGLALEPIIAAGQSPIDAVLNPNGAFQFVGGNAGTPGAFFKADRNNFAPILSFAWSPRYEKGMLGKVFGNGKTVFRGGFRMDYVNDELVRAPDNALLNNSGLTLASNVINPATGTVSLNARVSALPAIPAPTFVANRTFLLNNQVGGLQAAAFAVDPNLQIPRVSEYSFGIQREIGWKSVLEVRYVGSRSSNLTRASDYNQIDIRNNGFAADFNRAFNNCIAQGATLSGSGTPLQKCTNANFNPAIPGSVPLTVFPNLGGAGLLNNSVILGQLKAGIPADLAVTYVINALTGSVKFNPNPNIFVADVLNNGAFDRYNSLQIELRRRFSGGLYLNSNYTFEKEITNGQGTGQTRVEALLDNAQPNLEIARADYDQTQVFNLSAIYELPFGKGKRWLSGGNWLDRAVGGWEMTSIIRWQTGAPITFTDARGTLNRAARSARQTPVTNLTASQLAALTGVFVTPNGVFFINPSALQRNADGSLVGTPVPGTTAGRGANGIDPGIGTFAGQVLFNDPAGTTSGFPRAFVNGPPVFSWDGSLIKNVRITESTRLQLRAEFFNLMNHTTFTPGQFLDINSSTFGRITSTAIANRVIQFGARFEF
ncbi:MAG TPA: TonB-dependent receptor [Pyrinomonadaceae bacterium]|jgi:hypothetical protein|nr:TonB-dependent receptor [Pyrinomonadaceae bacterium]